MSRLDMSESEHRFGVSAFEYGAVCTVTETSKTTTLT